MLTVDDGATFVILGNAGNTALDELVVATGKKVVEGGVRR